MKLLSLAGLVALIGLFLLSGCAYHTKEARIIPPDTTVNCETLAAVTFADVKPIFTDNCDVCHATGTVPDLSDYTTIKDYISGNGTAFEDAVNFRNGVDKNMPQGGSKLAADKIKNLETWICQGMKP